MGSDTFHGDISDGGSDAIETCLTVVGEHAVRPGASAMADQTPLKPWAVVEIDDARARRISDGGSDAIETGPSKRGPNRSALCISDGGSDAIETSAPVATFSIAAAAHQRWRIRRH